MCENMSDSEQFIVGIRTARGLAVLSCRNHFPEILQWKLVRRRLPRLQPLREAYHNKMKVTSKWKHTRNCRGSKPI